MAIGKFKTKRSSDRIRNDLLTWLTRIGVNKSDIEINTGFANGKNYAESKYIYNGQQYTMRSEKQEKIRDNLAAIEMIIHSRSLSIEREIESFEQAFAGYKALECKNTLSTGGFFKQCETLEALKRRRNDLAKRFHPDKLAGNDEVWRMILEECEKKGAEIQS